MPRIETIDCLKGLAILCITLLHFESGIIPSDVNTWIGLFMISAFYFSAGWIAGIKKTDIPPKDLFLKRLRQLGIPYLWFSAVILLFDLIWCLCGFMEYKIFFRDIYKTLTFRGIGTLWFLPVLLFGEWLFCFVRTKKNKYLWGGCLLLFSLIASHFYYKYLPLRDNNDIIKLLEAPIRPVIYSLNAWIVIFFGWLGGEYLYPKIKNMKNSQSVICGILLLAAGYAVVVFKINIIFLSAWCVNVTSALGFLLIFSGLSGNYISDFFSYWGRNSLILMCLHFSIFQEIMMTVDKRLLHHTSFTGIWSLMYFVITVAIVWLLVPLFTKKLKFMLGK